MTFILKNKYYVVTAISIYILILIPSLNTPFQSDDYSYFLKGISWNSTISHYMGWSGRLIVDFTSSFLLKYLPYFLYEAINSFVFLLLCIFISLIPTIITHTDHTHTKQQPSAIILWLVFITYWLANPNLGQTSFWIVGSVNYLWTIMWASFYIYYLLKNIHLTHYNLKQYISIIFLGFLAGCSNENTSVSIVALTFLLLIFQYHSNKHHNYFVYFGLISTLIGTIILIAAPGNRVRQTHFESWYNQSTLEQIIIHVVKRMPRALLEYNNIYIVLTILFIVLISYKKKSVLQDKTIIFSLVFFLLSLFANFVLAKAPYIGGRNLNTGLFFLSLCFSCLAYSLYFNQMKNTRLIINSITIVYTIFFAASYILFTNMMIQANYQQQVRENLILTAIKNNEISVSIPDWYFMPTLKRLDTFDPYQSGMMPQYYGIQSIIWKPINFNYAILITGNNILVNQTIKDELQLLKIYTQSNILQWKKQQITLEFNSSLKKYKNSYIVLTFHDKNGKTVQINQSINDEISIGNNFYINTSIKDYVHIDDVQYINIDIYNHDNTQQLSKVINL